MRFLLVSTTTLKKGRVEEENSFVKWVVHYCYSRKSQIESKHESEREMQNGKRSNVNELMTQSMHAELSMCQHLTGCLYLNISSDSLLFSHASWRCLPSSPTRTIVDKEILFNSAYTRTSTSISGVTTLLLLPVCSTLFTLWAVHSPSTSCCAHDTKEHSLAVVGRLTLLCLCWFYYLKWVESEW